MKNKEELKSWFEDDKLYVGEYVKHKIDQLDEPERIEETTHLLESVLKENKRLGKLLEEKHEEWLDLMDIINNRETETLSPKWVDDNSVYASSDGVTEEYVHVDDLQNLLVPKQEEVDRAYKDGYEKGKEHATKVIKPIIPRFVAEWIEEVRKQKKSLVYAITHIYDNNEIDEPPVREENILFRWMEQGDNEEVFARAWLDGFTVKEEPKYYAKTKEIKPPEKEWLTNLSGPNYYAIDKKGLMLGEFLLDLVGMKTEASTHTLKYWERHGINDDNADFVEVEELEK